VTPLSFDGSGRLTAGEIAAMTGERILAGASQLMKRGESTAEVFTSFLTAHFYGCYNWQSASYEITNR
jgi:hypothetical protein